MCSVPMSTNPGASECEAAATGLGEAVNDGGEGKAREGEDGTSIEAPTDEVAPPQCGLPSCVEEGTKKCSGCKAKWYCSKEHQLVHWYAQRTPPPRSLVRPL